MDEKTRTLYELCQTVERELEEANEKIRKAGKMTAGDVDYIDKLTHTMKSIKTTIAMIEGDYGYSGRYYDGRMYHYDGNSYARGRGSQAKRDSMGRYSSRMDGRYSRDDAKADMIDDIKDIMHDAPDERTKQKFQRFISELESM